MKFQSLIKLLPIVTLVVTCQIQAMDTFGNPDVDYGGKLINDCFENSKTQSHNTKTLKDITQPFNNNDIKYNKESIKLQPVKLNDMELKLSSEIPISQYKIRIAEKYDERMQQIYFPFLKVRNKKLSNKMSLKPKQMKSLMQNYSEYLLPKIMYYCKQIIDLQKNINAQNISKREYYSKVCSLLSKHMSKISAELRKKNNSITYKQFYNEYIKNNAIFRLLTNSCISVTELDNKKKYEKLVSEVIHNEYKTDILTALLLQIYNYDIPHLLINLSPTGSIVNNENIVLFKGFANDLLNADDDKSAQKIFSIYISTINNIINTKLASA
ncbi:MAG: hypothetical protein IJ848_02810 [Alphaproteobacteria bacterium]|nr:hypothetical protein [Alphaproteobacteria bacterium]